jgi:hypothetical protein
MKTKPGTFNTDGAKTLMRGFTNWLIDIGWAIKAGTPETRIAALNSSDHVVDEVDDYFAEKEK